MAKKLSPALWLLALLTLALMGLGSYVRGTGAGLSCPDWPLCFGAIVPHTFENGVFQEVWHRYIATFVGLLTIWIVAISWKHRSESPGILRYALILLAVVIFQGLLGGLTVLWQLNPFVVTAHLVFGTVFLQLLVLGAVEALGRKPPTSPSSEPRGLLLLGAILTFAQIGLGGFVGASGAALACPAPILCFGEVVTSDWLGPQLVQMAHRALGALIFAVALILIFRGAKPRGHYIGLVVLLLLQIAVGIGNVQAGIKPGMTIMHLVFAELILLAFLARWKKNTPSFKLLG